MPFFLLQQETRVRMIAFKLQISVVVLMLVYGCLAAQRRHAVHRNAEGAYGLRVHSVDKDAAFIAGLGISTTFSSREECARYINRLPARLQAQGYINASVDSVQYDTAAARIVLYAGRKYQWQQLGTRQIDPAVLAATGWNDRMVRNPVDPGEMAQWQEHALDYLENKGYPFAKVYLDSIQIREEQISAQLKLEPGPLYRIDSIRVFGDAKISNSFLQHYLGISNGSPYSKAKLQQVSRRIRELSFVEEAAPPSIIWLGTGAVLELHLKARRSSQVNVLVGLLPNNEQLSSGKMLLTGEADIGLRNVLGVGETIALRWQQLQVRSPQLHFLYQHPYLFHSPAGLDLAFDMFRRDSIFLNVNFQLGLRYGFGANRSGALFLQRFSTIVNSVDTQFVLQNYRLPAEADVGTTNLGFDYQLNATDYRPNPSTGHELRIITAAGIKKIRMNNQVRGLKDPGNPSFDFASLYDSIKLRTYQLSVRVTAAKYFPLGGQRRSVLRAALNGGWLQSSALFRNELFRIGGYRLLRGFDEESQYLSQFAIATAEYRYRVGQDSYFYVFTDGGWGRDNSRDAGLSYGYFGTGVGLSLATRAGIFNLAWAVGKRSDLDLNLRQSKIHFGFAGSF